MPSWLSLLLLLHCHRHRLRLFPPPSFKGKKQILLLHFTIIIHICGVICLFNLLDFLVDHSRLIIISNYS
ncbi:hypothetical protein IC575_026932 [Cucumis melo]